ncbi:unnamed protein product [Pleuronectes platessa]|uniref:Uncharacterized protein n=1 Tax=Pleuronectes platessa TaxID=8262 RepID=A0A9N7VK26_PLEPL|nr:unnamed protein product [Pleuronectes platessa]
MTLAPNYPRHWTYPTPPQTQDAADHARGANSQVVDRAQGERGGVRRTTTGSAPSTPAADAIPLLHSAVHPATASLAPAPPHKPPLVSCVIGSRLRQVGHAQHRRLTDPLADLTPLPPSAGLGRWRCTAVRWTSHHRSLQQMPPIITRRRPPQPHRHTSKQHEKKRIEWRNQPTKDIGKHKLDTNCAGTP